MDAAFLSGTVTLTNTKQYPFNNSAKTVALQRSLQDQEYMVQAEIIGEPDSIGDIMIFDKAVNGFKIAFTGSAQKAVVQYRVIGVTAGDHSEIDEATAIPYSLNGSTLTFGSGALAVDLAEYQQDWPVSIDISEDSSGTLVLGPSHRYIAQIDIPERVSRIEKGKADDFGFPQLKKLSEPLDTSNVALTLWALEV